MVCYNDLFDKTNSDSAKNFIINIINIVNNTVSNNNHAVIKNSMVSLEEILYFKEITGDLDLSIRDYLDNSVILDSLNIRFIYLPDITLHGNGLSTLLFTRDSNDNKSDPRIICTIFADSRYKEDNNSIILCKYIIERIILAKNRFDEKFNFNNLIIPTLSIGSIVIFEYISTIFKLIDMIFDLSYSDFDKYKISSSINSYELGNIIINETLLKNIYNWSITIGSSSDEKELIIYDIFKYNVSIGNEI